MVNINSRQNILKNLRCSFIGYLCNVIFILALAFSSAEAFPNGVVSHVANDSLVGDSATNLNTCIDSFLKAYPPLCKISLPIGLEYCSVNETNKRVDVYVKEGFASQVFTSHLVKDIYSKLSQSLPYPYSGYEIRIYTHNIELSRFVSNLYADEVDSSRLSKYTYKGNEWVRNMSKPFDICQGLQGSHLTVWASHGRYYDFSKNAWIWQRPNLYCTTEDLFTRSIVVPFLIPMLENSGAVVYMPRERDENTSEIIVDNDGDSLYQKGTYNETVGAYTFDTYNKPGFKQLRELYMPGQNPHEEGTARIVKAIKDSAKVSSCCWMPDIPADGDYALYITYPYNDNNIDDATYIVRHNNVETKIRVNQRMGGGTWVYLGTFGFSKGCNLENSITLSNLSNCDGVVMADAIRIGGGMGNMVRNGETSGLPRFMEGALYYAQWSGMPYGVYSTKDGRNDYADDINARSNSLNYLTGGSIYSPQSEGLHVPMELSLAVHSDAGYAMDNSVVGTLGIFTYLGDRGTYNLLSGVSRLSSLDLAAYVQNEVCRDLNKHLGNKWTQRELYNRNYSETRKPEVPSMILETLSHQNFRDMLYGHDPNFKFLISRSIYKAIARYIAFQHHRNCVIHPLPVRSFSAVAADSFAVLSWSPQLDSLEPTATPTKYVVYVSKNGNDFDNGHVVENGALSVRLPIEKDVVYRFKVTACNDGGESFPSETLAVLSASEERRRILVVNGFTRLSAPDVIMTEDKEGFDISSDIGVPYMKTAEYCGSQRCFLRSKEGIVGSGGLGYSGSELEGKIIAGNNFDYAYIHASAIKDKKHRYSVSSCSSEAIADSLLAAGDFQLVDLLFGLQRDDGISSLKHYKTFTTKLKKLVSDYLCEGGKVFVSGAYIGRDMNESAEHDFTTNYLCYSLDSCMETPPSITVGNNTFSIVKEWNPDFYAVKSVDVLGPSGLAEPFAYYENNACAAVATSNVIVLGFPFESIDNSKARHAVMRHILRKLF